jgi:hypothetical protein
MSENSPIPPTQSHRLQPGNLFRITNAVGLPLDIHVETPARTKMRVKLALGTSVEISVGTEIINLVIEGVDESFEDMHIVKD